MKALILSSILALSFQNAFADHHLVIVDPSVTSCAEMQALLQQNGSIGIDSIFGHNVHVASGRQCGFYESSSPAYVRSADKNFCRLGYVCQPTEGYP
jgi:hypothetical protein